MRPPSQLFWVTPIPQTGLIWLSFFPRHQPQRLPLLQRVIVEIAILSATPLPPGASPPFSPCPEFMGMARCNSPRFNGTRTENFSPCLKFPYVNLLNRPHNGDSFPRPLLFDRFLYDRESSFLLLCFSLSSYLLTCRIASSASGRQEGAPLWRCYSRVDLSG